MPIHYVIRTYVENVSEQFRVLEIRKDPENTTNSLVKREPLGWFIRLRGSQEQLHVGWEKPDLQIGDEVKITIERNNSGRV
jgi:hypothetical protein